MRTLFEKPHIDKSSVKAMKDPLKKTISEYIEEVKVKTNEKVTEEEILLYLLSENKVRWTDFRRYVFENNLDLVLCPTKKETINWNTWDLREKRKI